MLGVGGSFDAFETLRLRLDNAAARGDPSPGTSAWSPDRRSFFCLEVVQLARARAAWGISENDLMTSDGRRFVSLICDFTRRIQILRRTATETKPASERPRLDSPARSGQSVSPLIPTRPTSSWRRTETLPHKTPRFFPPAAFFLRPHFLKRVFLSISSPSPTSLLSSLLIVVLVVVISPSPTACLHLAPTHPGRIASQPQTTSRLHHPRVLGNVVLQPRARSVAPPRRRRLGRRIDHRRRRIAHLAHLARHVVREHRRHQRQHLWRHLQPAPWRLQPPARPVVAGRKATHQGRSLPLSRQLLQTADCDMGRRSPCSSTPFSSRTWTTRRS